MANETPSKHFVYQGDEIRSGVFVSTYAMNSTNSANEAYWRVKEDKGAYNKNKEKIDEIKKEIDSNYDKQAKSETLVLISDSLLKFAPTFIFGVLAYSTITNPTNICLAIIILIIFLVILIIFYYIRIQKQAELYKIGNLQKELEKKLNELEKPKNS